VTKRGPMRFAGAQLFKPRHVCAFFNSEAEQYRVLMPFIKDGFDCGQKAIHILSESSQPRHLGHLAAAAIDVKEAQRSGQLDIRTNAEVYLSGGSFDADRMLQVFEDFASSPVGDPYPLSRIVCQMEWASQHPGCMHHLIEFEARVNYLWSHHDHAVICVYDLAKFGGDTVVDVIRTHPMIIVGGLLQQNPFFVPPEQFLRELRQRPAEQAQSLRYPGGA
jgi:MEDS: MEthanogen/methylotroph, DcmR Sensory domain